MNLKLKGWGLSSIKQHLTDLYMEACGRAAASPRECRGKRKLDYPNGPRTAVAKERGRSFEYILAFAGPLII